MNIFSKFFTSATKVLNGERKRVSLIEQIPITLTPPLRRSRISEEERKRVATELLDTYSNYGLCYIDELIKTTIQSLYIQQEMRKLAKALPLLEFFTNSISRVYSIQPTRRFYLDGKEIIKKPKLVKDNTLGLRPYDGLLDLDKFIHNDELFDVLNDLYNDNVNLAIKQAERYTNLLGTTIYKVVTDDMGKIKILFIPNDLVHVKIDKDDRSRVDQIAYIQDTTSYLNNRSVIVPVIETWSCEAMTVNIENDADGETENKSNEACIEYEALFGTKKTLSAFAPFVVFRSSGSVIDFWDMKGNDILNYIKSINISLTELDFLRRYTSFGLKYGINVDLPKDAPLSPVGFISFEPRSTLDNRPPQVGEFENNGKIDEVIRAIIFNLKMLFSLYSLPLDALISTNSVRSAESKDMDNQELNSAINSQRDIWNKNEQELFKVMQAIHNRDNNYQIPKGIEIQLDYDNKEISNKTTNDWLVEIQNNVHTVIDWISDIYPDKDKDELMDLFMSNKAINDALKEQPDTNFFENRKKKDYQESDNIINSQKP